MCEACQLATPVGLPAKQERLEPWTSRNCSPRCCTTQVRLVVCLKVDIEQALVARNAMRDDGLQAPALGTLNTDDSRRQHQQGLVQHCELPRPDRSQTKRLLASGIVSFLKK